MKGQRAVEIVRAYVLAFFDKYVKEGDVPLLDGPSEEYPEINIQVRGIE